MEKKTYKELIVWTRAMDLVGVIYDVTRHFPDTEQFGLTAQLRRAAVSIPSNVAEGQGRQSTREFAQFVSVAYGSLRELETQIMIAARLGYLDERGRDAVLSLAGEIGRLLNGLSRSLRQPRQTGTAN